MKKAPHCRAFECLNRLRLLFSCLWTFSFYPLFWQPWVLQLQAWRQVQQPVLQPVLGLQQAPLVPQVQ